MRRRTTSTGRLTVVERLEQRQLLSTVAAPRTGSSQVVQLTQLPSDSQYYSPIDPTSFDGALFYLAADPSTGSGATLLWRSNGTPAGTVPVVVNGAKVTGGTSLAAGADTLYVVSGTTLYKTDGATTLSATPLPATDAWQVLGVAGSRAYLLQGFNPLYGTTAEVWSTDGTAAGTVDLGHYTAPESPVGGGGQPRGVAVGDTFIFKFGGTVYRSDGTMVGTTAISTPEGDHGIVNEIVASGNTVYFDTSRSSGLWASDGTAAGTHELLSGAPGYSNLTAGANGGAFFYAPLTTDLRTETLWYTDGTAGGTIDVAFRAGVLLEAPDQQDVTVLDGKAFFVGQSPTTASFELYSSDGTVAGTTAVADLGAEVSPLSVNLATDAGRVDLLMSDVSVGSEGLADGTLYVSDGTPAGTVKVGSSVPQGTLTAAADRLFITTPNYQSSLSGHVAPGQLLAYAISTETGVVPTVTRSSVPGALLYGKPIAGTVRVSLRNGMDRAATAAGPTVVEVYASQTAAIDGDSVLVGRLARRIRLGAGRSATVGVAVRAGSLPVATYALLVRVTDGAGDIAASTEGPTLVIAAPEISLSATFGRPLPVKAGGVGAVSVSVRNDGNIPAGGPLFNVVLSLVVSGFPRTITVVKPPARLTVGTRRTATVRLRFHVPADLAGSYPVQINGVIGSSPFASTANGTVVVR